jgi:uncharacterized protein with GYD domain
MPTYVTLYTLTDQGARELKTLPERVRATQANAEQQGFKVLAWYLTQGRYDVVTIVEAPDEMSVAAGTLAIVGHGNFRTETLRAFSLEEAEQIIQRLG